MKTYRIELMTLTTYEPVELIAAETMDIAIAVAKSRHADKKIYGSRCQVAN